MLCTNGLNALRRARAKSFLSLFTCVFFTLPNTPAKQSTVREPPTISAGTILPVILQTTISPQKSRPGEAIHGEIALDVPLPGGSKIRKGSRVEGHVIQVVDTANASAAKISLRFDTLRLRGRIVLVTTDLRAIASFMEVLDARVPNQAVGEGDVSNWMTTTQIGGDSVFGIGGPVTSAHNATEVVGKSLMNGGVLARVSPNESGNCRGAIGGNNQPQALWVFSSDACGTYGLSHVKILHAGKTDPVGTITLELRDRRAKIPNGAGLLLRVLG